MTAESVIDLYKRRAQDFDRDRDRSLQEKKWLDRFLRHVPASGTILDIGCGMGEPIAQYFIEARYRVVGIDSSPSMIEMCRARFPDAEWLVGDMRQIELHRRFDGILAWDSCFFLGMNDQQAMFSRFAAHALPGSPLMFTSGVSAGELIGSYHGEPLYHASLDSGEYERLLSENGFLVEAHQVEDPDCGKHTIWLATYSR
jgi:trans-aconitate methyltransferase